MGPPQRFFDFEWHRVELEPVMHQAVAEAPRYVGLEALDLFGLELDHLAGLDVDQVIVMLALCPFVAGAPVAESMARDDAAIFQELHGAVDGGERDACVHRGGAAVQLFGVGMILRLAEHSGDDAALAGHAQALGGAGLLDGLRRHDRRFGRRLVGRLGFALLGHALLRFRREFSRPAADDGQQTRQDRGPIRVLSLQ